MNKAFRLLVKKRFYIRCVRDYLALFKGIETGLLGKKGGLAEPYIYYSDFEENPFTRPFGSEALKEEAKQGEDAEKILTQEALKI